MLEKIEKFKNREISAKELFTLSEIPQKMAITFCTQYHYLEDAPVKPLHSFGLWIGGDLVGIATFSMTQGNVANKGWFGLEANDKSILELSRLAMIPQLNGTNATSYFLSACIRYFKKTKTARAIISLADASRHVGSIYQVCNFEYFGLTNPKSDFFTPDGRVNPRGSTSVKHGVWLPRTRKHRYAYILDKNLKCLYNKCDKPKRGETLELTCCGGSHKVYDNRFNEWYTCPRCTGKLELITE